MEGIASVLHEILDGRHVVDLVLERLGSPSVDCDEHHILSLRFRPFGFRLERERQGCDDDSQEESFHNNGIMRLVSQIYATFQLVEYFA